MTLRLECWSGVQCSMCPSVSPLPTMEPLLLGDAAQGGRVGTLFGTCRVSLVFVMGCGGGGVLARQWDDMKSGDGSRSVGNRFWWAEQVRCTVQSKHKCTAVQMLEKEKQLTSYLVHQNCTYSSCELLRYFIPCMRWRLTHRLTEILQLHGTILGDDRRRVRNLRNLNRTNPDGQKRKFS